MQHLFRCVNLVGRSWRTWITNQLAPTYLIMYSSKLCNWHALVYIVFSFSVFFFCINDWPYLLSGVGGVHSSHHSHICLMMGKAIGLMSEGTKSRPARLPSESIYHRRWNGGGIFATVRSPAASNSLQFFMGTPTHDRPWSLLDSPNFPTFECEHCKIWADHHFARRKVVGCYLVCFVTFSIFYRLDSYKSNLCLLENSQ